MATLTLPRGCPQVSPWFKKGFAGGFFFQNAGQRRINRTLPYGGGRGRSREGIIRGLQQEVVLVV